MKLLKLYNQDLDKNIFYYFIMKSKRIRRNLNKTRKHQKKSTNKRKIYRRKTRKQGGNGSRFGLRSIRVLPEEVVTIKKKIEDLVKDLNLKNCNNLEGISLESCSKPDSKSKQLIHICRNSVYKGPPSKFQPKIAVRGNVIKVDPHTMNLLVQGCIRQLPQKDTIEKYDEICKTTIDSNTSYAYALKGPRYSYNLKNDFDIDDEAFSIEDFIEKTAEHMEASGQQTQDLKIKIAAKIVEWILSFTKDLDYLFTEMQFHHCDPKAAQLFLNSHGEVILGDLDKVTFTMKINDTLYRTCLADSIISQQSLHRIDGWLGSNKSSIPTVMRYENKPYTNNKYEKGVFIASILLLLHEDIANKVIETIYSLENAASKKEDINSILEKIRPLLEKIDAVVRNKMREILDKINVFFLDQMRAKLDAVDPENFSGEAEKELKKKNENRNPTPDEILKKAKSLKFKSKTSHILASKCVEFDEKSDGHKNATLDSNVRLEGITNKPPGSDVATP